MDEKEKEREQEQQQKQKQEKGHEDLAERSIQMENLEQKPLGPSPAKMKAAKKRMIQYGIMFFAAAIIIILVAYLPQIRYSDEVDGIKALLDAKNVEAATVYSKMENMQNEFTDLRKSYNLLEEESTKAQKRIADLETANIKAEEAIKLNLEAIKLNQEEIKTQLLKKEAADYSARLIMLYYDNEKDEAREVLAAMVDGKYIELLEIDIKEKVEVIQKALTK